ncbi:hypothetical protein LG634_02910 [Streptomyces bambusae]|uniref:hypothetical protein n=1 Tax=Streptomyces bambusae TaxID=1550616 RepID=UPI001CFEA1DA|nr:hypothetical protein [Streptomyces bambusae]MCB5163794.1 hypothetical protein [Streptomyces bambusae]
MYEATLRPRLERLAQAWPDAATVRGFKTRLATEDLARAMAFNAPRKVATAHALTELLTAHGGDTHADLRAWLGRPAHRATLRAVTGVGPKTVDYLGNLVGGSQVAIDVHLRTFAAEAGIPDLPYAELRGVYEEAAVLLGHEPGGLDHAVWRYVSGAAR